MSEQIAIPIGVGRDFVGLCLELHDMCVRRECTKIYTQYSGVAILITVTTYIEYYNIQFYW